MSLKEENFEIFGGQDNFISKIDVPDKFDCMIFPLDTTAQGNHLLLKIKKLKQLTINRVDFGFFFAFFSTLI